MNCIHGYFPDAEESEYMVDTVSVEVFGHFFETLHPPAITVLFHHFPIISRKSPILSVYREILRKEFEEYTCFYCGKNLGKNIHVDHFIPWSFVKDDKLWNFVLSCARCNERKSNKLPKQDFLIKIEQRNKGIQVVDNIIVQKDFERYSQDLLNRMWKYAKMSGLKEVEMRT